MKQIIELTEIQKERWMEKLLRRAMEIGERGEVPVAALILDFKGNCIGYGSNRRQTEKNPLGHAELIALKQASSLKNDWRFNECTMIVTLEPCPMCAGALIQGRMGQVIYGASDFKRGGLGGVIDLSKDKSAHHNMKVEKGVIGSKSTKLIEEWFRRHRA